MFVLADSVLVISDNLVNIGNRYYVEATATIKHKDQSESAKGYAREAETKKGMDEAQITGAASSYARKYALNGLFLIDDQDSKDPDMGDNRNNSINKTKSAKKYLHDGKEYTEDQLLKSGWTKQQINQLKPAGK